MGVFSFKAVAGLIILLAVFVSPIAGQTAEDSTIVDSVEFSGLVAVDLAEAEAAFGIRPGERYDAGRVQEGFRALWKLDVFRDVSVEVRNAGEGRTALTVRTQERLTVVEVTYERNEIVTPDQIAEHLENSTARLAIGAPLAPSAVAGVRYQIKVLLIREGYPEASVRSAVEERSPTTCRVHFTIAPGRPFASILKSLEQTHGPESWKVHFELRRMARAYSEAGMFAEARPLYARLFDREVAVQEVSRGQELQLTPLWAIADEFAATLGELEDYDALMEVRQRQLALELASGKEAAGQEDLKREEGKGFVPTGQYEKRSIEGWTIFVNKDLLADGTELGSKALELLEAKLYEVGRVVPEKACEELRRVPIWLGVEDGSSAGYHPSREWLRANGYNPDKAKSVEIGNASRFLFWSFDQPGTVLHELAHAYHDRVLGYDHEGIRAAFRAAVEGGRYERVLRFNGREERAYALENDQEYFAEGTEAFFGTNDWYPFVRAELLRHDPKLFEVLEEVWGTSATHAQGLPSAEIEWPAGRGKVTIPFDYENGFVVVPVSVMGSRPLQMMLSTGSPLIVIPDESLAETMDLNIVAEVQVDGDGDREMQTAPLAMGVDAVVGGLEISKGSVLVGSGKEVLQDVDGVIGASIFRNCVVEINWTDRELHLYDPVTYEYDGNGAVLDLTVAANGHAYVDGFAARLGGPNWTELKLHLDSGVRGALTLYAGSDEQIKIPEGAVESIVAWGSRGPARGFLSTIDALKIGSTELSALPTSFSETYKGGEPGVPDHHGKLGLTVLERFNTLIDYPGGRLILEPTKESARPFSTNTTGVRLAPGKAGADRLEIAYVIADSPAAKIGVRQGDSVTEVNGKAVASMKYAEIWNVWRSEPGTKLRLTIERDGSPMELLLTAASFF